MDPPLPVPARSLALVARHSPAPTRRADRRTTRRLADVRGDGQVTGEKIRELYRLGGIAKVESALGQHLSEALAAGDPFLLDQLEAITEVLKLGSIEILVDFIDGVRAQ